jgi:lysophospholipase L1-like esterase
MRTVRRRPLRGVRPWLTLAILVACSGRTGADPAESGTAPRAAASGPSFAAPAGSMPLLSRAVPATASSGKAAWAQDDVYARFPPDHMWSCHGDCWLAYDLSQVPEEVRSSLYLVLFFGGNAQYQLNVNSLGGVDLKGVPTGGYRIEASASASGPWTTLVAVTSLAQASRVHRVDFRGYSWLRFSAPEATKLKMDVYGAAGGVPEGLVLYGDSIANMQCVGLPQSWFSSGVAARAPGRFPPIVGGGIAFTTAMDGRDLIVKGAGPFSKGMGGALLDTYAPVPYLALTFGTNDAAPGPNTNEQAFYQAYLDIIRAALAKGVVVAVSTPTWSPEANRQLGLKRLIGRIGLHPKLVPGWSPRTYQALEHVWREGKVYRCTQAGSSLKGPAGSGSNISDGGSARWDYVPSLRETLAREVGERRVRPGPDMYSLFADQPGWFVDGVHPNPTGSAAWQKAWIDWAMENMYR